MASTRTGLVRTAAAHVLSPLSLATNRLRKFSVPPSPGLLRLRSAALALSVFLYLGLFLCPALLSGIPSSRFNGVVAPLPTIGITLSLPSDMTVDLAGNIYIADTGNSRVVKINPQGTASVLAISGLGTALSFPTGVAVDASGILYIADSGNNRIVFLSVAGSSLAFTNAKSGSTSTDSPKSATVTNLGNQPLVVASDPAYTADFSENSADPNLCASSTTRSAGTVCNVSVNFTPQSAGSLSANITVTNNTLNVASSTQQVSVSGTGLISADSTALSTTPHPSLPALSPQLLCAPAPPNTTSMTINKAAAAMAGPTGQPIQIISGQLGSVVVTVTGSYSGLALPSGSLGYSILDSSSASIASGSATLTPGTTNSSAAVPIANSLAAGVYTLHITYGGDSNYAASSTASTIQFAVADFSFSASTGSSTSATVSVGGTASYTLAANPGTGTTFPDTVSFSVTGLPIGAVASFSPQTLAAGSSATNVTLAIQVPTQTASLRNNHLLALQSSSILLGILLLPFSERMSRLLAKRACTITVLLVALALSALGALAGCNSGSTPTHQPVNYTLTVIATSGTLTHSTALTLTIR